MRVIVLNIYSTVDNGEGDERMVYGVSRNMI